MAACIDASANVLKGMAPHGQQVTQSWRDRRARDRDAQRPVHSADEGEVETAAKRPEPKQLPVPRFTNRTLGYARILLVASAMITWLERVEVWLNRWIPKSAGF
jgi:hypothetical protein